MRQEVTNIGLLWEPSKFGLSYNAESVTFSVVVERPAKPANANSKVDIKIEREIDMDIEIVIKIEARLSLRETWRLR